MRTGTPSGKASPTLRHRLLVAIVASGALVVVVAAPAMAQGNRDSGREHLSNRRIGIGNVFVAENEALNTPVVAVDGDATVDGSTTEGVFAVNGNARIRGHVGGSVVVLGGNARISGRVDDGVTVLGGRAIIEDGAVVRGDVQSTDEPRVASDARVTGHVNEINVTGMFTALGFALLGFLWLAVTISSAVLGVILLGLFGRPFDAAARTAGTSLGASFGIGVLVAVGLPALALLAATTAIGLPFGFGTLGALGIIETLGYLTSALCLGRLMIKEPSSIFGAFFAGWAILRAAALIPGLGALVWVGASVYGVGALTLTAWRASRAPSETMGKDATVQDVTNEPAPTSQARGAKS